MCYPAEFGRSSSNGSSVTKENPPEKFDLLRTAFQGHYSLRSSEPIRIDRLRVTFYKKKIHSNYGPISYRFGDKRQLQSKIAIFSTPCVFTAPAERISLGTGWPQENRMMGLSGKEERFIISVAVWILHECDRQMDRQTYTGRRLV